MAIDTNSPDETVTSDLFDVDSNTAPQVVPPVQPLYQIYAGSKIAVSKQVGIYWKRKYDAAVKAYTDIKAVWEDCYRYYNHSHDKATQTPRGLFRRGDCTENVIYSNLNIMLPAIYSRDPDVTITTNDKEDQPFSDCLEALLNAMFHRKHLLDAKPKIKKAAGVALLTNFGILKLDWTKKDDSLQQAQEEMVRISEELVQAKDQQTVEDLYGQLMALEASMEALKPSGPSLGTVLPHMLIIDPYAEQPDGSDATWMCEKIFYPTSALKAKFTVQQNPDEEKGPRGLIYKPTHKAVFTEGAAADGQRDDALGMVMRSLDGQRDEPISFEPDERRAYVDMYFTECRLLWDRTTKRVMLFHRDDWTWPIWVWDDPLSLTRFFPYFVIGFSMTTGGTIGAGETAYVLDQQDEINDINRQIARIRRTVFDYFYYNSDVVSQDEAEKFIGALRAPTTAPGKHILGVKAGEGGKVQDMIQAFVPPSMQFEELFNKKNILDTINRTTNTSDALRGVQFKTNTNVASVQSYQESLRLSVGAKVDVIEDVVADLALALAELAVQNYAVEDVANLVGGDLAQAWQPMDVQTFTQKYSVEIVAGSMEKPNSVFRKKEAIEVAQAVGQFARAAPGAVTQIMLRVLQQAFTEVAIKPEDWQLLNAEVNANLQKGISQPGQGAPPANPRDAMMAKAKTLPPQDQQKVMEMSNGGAQPQDILKFIQQQTGAPNA